MTIDAVLDDDYDFQIGADGDILTADFFDTALLMSLFAERRATASEMPESHRRRGWIGNESTPGFEIGSKLWLLEQARISRTVLSETETAAYNGLEWMLDGIAVNIFTSASLRNGIIVLELITKRPNSKVEKRYYETWNNTGVQ